MQFFVPERAEYEKCMSVEQETLLRACLAVFSVLFELLGNGQQSSDSCRAYLTLYSGLLGVLSKHYSGCLKEPSK